LGSAFGRAAEAGDRFLLEGPFGAGKTTFVQGLAQGLDVETPVGSPSFVIETQHRGRLRLYHIDLYRLERIEPALLDELEEHLYGDGVTAVEWPERLPEQIREGTTTIRFRVDGDARRLEITAANQRIRQAAAMP
jgi:tRNA threonylcarbamoyladenosine biosynthesis protein TsaE